MMVLVRNLELTTSILATDQLSTQEPILEIHTNSMPGPTQSMVPHGDTEETLRPWEATDMATVKDTDILPMVMEDQAGDISHATTERGKQ